MLDKAGLLKNPVKVRLELVGLFLHLLIQVHNRFLLHVQLLKLCVDRSTLFLNLFVGLKNCSSFSVQADEVLVDLLSLVVQSLVLLDQVQPFRGNPVQLTLEKKIFLLDLFIFQSNLVELLQLSVVPLVERFKFCVDAFVDRVDLLLLSTQCVKFVLECDNEIGVRERHI